MYQILLHLLSLLLQRGRGDDIVTNFAKQMLMEDAHSFKWFSLVNLGGIYHTINHEVYSISWQSKSPNVFYLRS